MKKLNLNRGSRLKKNRYLRTLRKNGLSDSMSFDELNTKKTRILRSRGIYLLPNAFTALALFCGFFAIVQAMNHHFDVAAIAVFCAMLLDGMDGRVARLTNTQSAFGEQFDSLSDMVSFGVAPALMIYESMLKDFGRLGWLAAFIYCAGGALRLARFNANIGVVDKRFFQGLPIPAAAALIAGFSWLTADNRLPFEHHWIPYCSLALTIYAGVTMVSNVPFYSGKALDVRHRVPFATILLVIISLVLISSDPPLMLFGLFILYSLSGYIYWIYLFLFKKSNPAQSLRED